MELDRAGWAEGIREASEQTTQGQASAHSQGCIPNLEVSKPAQGMQCTLPSPGGKEISNEGQNGK